MQVQPYLYFYGRCEEAVGFYKRALGADAVELMRFQDAPEPMPAGMLPPGFESKIMHGTFRLGDITVMVSDGSGSGSAGHHGFGLAITLATEAESRRCFTALADGGQIGMALGRTFWSPCFGSVTDRFGVTWMINTAA